MTTLTLPTKRDEAWRYSDLAALETLLLRVSDFVVSHADRIEEMDLNPVWVGAMGESALPLDAVIIERVSTGDAA